MVGYRMLAFFFCRRAWEKGAILFFTLGVADFSSCGGETMTLEDPGWRSSLSDRMAFIGIPQNVVVRRMYAAISLALCEAAAGTKNCH